MKQSAAKLVLGAIMLCSLMQLSAKSSLDGKKVIFIGNSFIYYGGCVINSDKRQLDKGLFHELCRQNGDKVDVYDCTYGGHYMKDFTEKGCASPKLHKKGTSGQCEGVGTQLLEGVPLDDMDVVFLSEAGVNNKDIIKDLAAVKKRFTNPKTKFYYLVHTHTYYRNHRGILDNLQKMKEMGIDIVPWGEVAYQLTTGQSTIKGSTLKYHPQSFIKNKGDLYHPNPLAGYLTAMMAYCACSGKKATGQKYDFVEKIMPAADYLEKHYEMRQDTDYPEILASRKDMKGIQKLADKLLAKANR